MPEIPAVTIQNPNPIPLDARAAVYATPEQLDEHVAIARATATAVGVDPDSVEETIRAVPVYDVPARQDVPKPTKPRRGVEVTLRPLADGFGDYTPRTVTISNGTRWRREHGELAVLDGHTEAAAFARGTWEQVAYVDDTRGADA